MYKEKEIENFDKYYKNELDPAEKSAFEAQLSRDNTFQSAYSTYQETVEGIQAFERNRLKQELLNSVPQRSTSNIRRLSTHWVRIGVAASLALLVSVAIHWCSQSTDRIYASYELGKADNLMGMSETRNPVRQTYSDAIVLRNDGKYEAALKELTTISEEDIHIYFQAQYNMALIYTKIGKKEKAIPILEELTKRPENHFIKRKAKKMKSDLEWFCFF